MHVTTEVEPQESNVVLLNSNPQRGGYCSSLTCPFRGWEASRGCDAYYGWRRCSKRLRLVWTGTSWVSHVEVEMKWVCLDADGICIPLFVCASTHFPLEPFQ